MEKLLTCYKLGERHLPERLQKTNKKLSTYATHIGRIWDRLINYLKYASLRASSGVENS